MNKLLLFSVFSILTLNVMAQEKIVQTAGRDQLGTFAPKFAELNDDVLFGEVWSRTDKPKCFVFIRYVIMQYDREKGYKTAAWYVRQITYGG